MPNASIDEIFARMQVRYAAQFTRNFEGMDMAAVKSDWGQVLEGCSAGSIAYALVNLPLDWPPNAMQFHALCVRGSQARKDPQLTLPAPTPDPARLRAAFERMRQIAKGRSPTAWIGDLDARLAKGEHIPIESRKMLAQAKANLGWDRGEIEITEEDRERTVRLKEETQRKVDAYAMASGTSTRAHAQQGQE